MKVFKLFFFISLCYFLIFISCKKKNDKLTISGTAYNTEIQQNVTNVKVDLYLKKLSNNTWNAQYELLSSMNTLFDGSFKFEFDNVRVSDFKLIFSKQGYFTNEYIINPDLVQKGKDYHQTYSVHYKSWLELLIKNFQPASADDVMSYKFLKGLDNVQDTFKFFNGSNVDTLNIWKIYGSQLAVIEWNVTNGSNHIQYIDSLWIPASDTLKFNLYY